MYPKDKVAIMWRAKSHTWATHNSTFQKGRVKWVQNVYDWVWFPAPQRYKTMVFSTVELELWVYHNKIVESFYCFKRNSYSIPKWSPQANSVHIYLPTIYHVVFYCSIFSCSVCKVHSCRITECYSLIKIYHVFHRYLGICIVPTYKHVQNQTSKYDRCLSVCWGEN